MSKTYDANDIKQRGKIVATWEKRILKMRPVVSSAAFCRKYGFNDVHLWRAKTLNPIPYWPFINRVEEALEKEGF